MQLRSREGSSGSQKGEDVMELQKSRGEQEQAQEQRQQRVKHRATVDAVAGAVAGGVSRTVVSPLDVIKIRFQWLVSCKGRCSWSRQVDTNFRQKYFQSTLD